LQDTLKSVDWSEKDVIQRLFVHQYIERVVDLTKPEENQIFNLTTEEARQ
jgi:hypothetical protein